MLLRKGKYLDLEEKPPLVLGYEVVGEVDQLGPGVPSSWLGERVADLTMTGSYALYRTLRLDRVVRVPGGVDAAEAVALVLSWETAYRPAAISAFAPRRPRFSSSLNLTLSA